MITIKCETKDSILLTEVTPFQGTLKKRTSEDISGLIASLGREGLLMPLAIWKHEDKNYLLDGHGRVEALWELAKEQPDIIETPLPCIYIEADTEDNARKALLQITSSYGKITKKGVESFMISIPDYVAPSVAKFVAKPVETKAKPVKDSTPKVTHKVLKVRIPMDKVDEVIKIFERIDFIEVL